VRGFVQGGGSLFAARDSFETILDKRFGLSYGGGGQVGFANGLFVQVGVSRLQETGSRAIVTASQIFRVDVPHTITTMPIEATAGYRMVHGRRVASYAGLGVGWHRFKESAASLEGADTTSTHVGYHVLAGAEFPMGGWLSLAGEAQWSKVPNAFGESGVSAAFGEKDLGGGTFRVKVLFGR
jgi:opacity protein-like surface antigen